MSFCSVSDATSEKRPVDRQFTAIKQTELYFINTFQLYGDILTGMWHI